MVLIEKPVKVNRPDEMVVVCKMSDGSWYFAGKKPEWMEAGQEITATREDLAMGLVLQGGRALVGVVGNRGEFVAFDMREPVLL